MPERVKLVTFGATLYATMPFPDPLAPATIVIQLTSDTALHDTPEPAVTETVKPVEPSPETWAVVGEIVVVPVAPNCVTMKSINV